MAIDTRPLASMNTFNAAGPVLDAEQMKYAKVRNELTGYQRDEVKNAIARREQREQIESMFAALPARIRKYREMGWHDDANQALDTLLAGKEMEVQMLDLMARSITADNWKQTRQELLEAGAIDGSQMPTEYSKKWVEDLLATKKGELRKLALEFGAGDKIMRQDLLVQDGEIVEELKPYETEGSRKARGAHEGDRRTAKPETPWQMTSGDSAQIYNQAAKQFDTILDQRGNFVGLTGDDKRKAQALAERASEIYRQAQGQVSHAEAVAQAARQQGLDINYPDDPAGIL